jgi:hypothetical protein
MCQSGNCGAEGRDRQVRAGIGGAAQVSEPQASLPAEMHKQPAVVFRVFLDPVVQGFDLFLIEKSEDPLL